MLTWTESMPICKTYIHHTLQHFKLKMVKKGQTRNLKRKSSQISVDSDDKINLVDKRKQQKKTVGEDGDTPAVSKYFTIAADDDTVASEPIPSSSAGTSDTRLGSKFYNKDCTSLARALLGKNLVRLVNGKRVTGRIVETEAYLGVEDKAAHSYKGKRTEKTEAMFMHPGTAYVYHIYGMYCCMNISANGEGAAVLLRSLQPLENLEQMDKLRTKGKSPGSLLKKEGLGLCNGPSKLCMALAITKPDCTKEDLTLSPHIWLEEGGKLEEKDIVISKRINIGYAEDWIEKPLRFYERGNKFVSVRDKEAEKK